MERLKYGRKREEMIVGAGIDRCIDSEKVSHTEKIEDRDRDIERQRDSEIERQRERETERQRDRETERQRDRETERLTKVESFT